MRQLAGNIGGKMASKRQLGGNLGHLKANLRPKRGQDSSGVMGVSGMREAILAPLRPTASSLRSLTQLRQQGRVGFSPQSGSPGAA